VARKKAVVAGLAGKQTEMDSAVLPIRPRNGSYESFVRDQSPRLLQSLSLIMRDRELAADAAQEAFIELYRHWEEMEEVRDPVAWLYRVAINRSRDYRRRLARSARLLERLLSTSTDDDWAAPDMAGTQLVTVFRALPLGQRTAATLYYLADLPIAEVARVMSVSEGTVNRHLYRAREALRGTLEADDG
jgi:RNA polymerase sigma-70 factor (ECF subfamily)